MKCEFSGCKSAATVAARKLWTAGDVLYTCDLHRPGQLPLPGQTISGRFYKSSQIGEIDPTVNVWDLVAGVRSPATAKKFIEWCCHVIGVGFHPDTPFGDYTRIGSDVKLFAPWQAEWLERSLACCFTFLTDVYATAMQCEPFKSTAVKR